MLQRVETRVVLVGKAGCDAALVKALEVKSDFIPVLMEKQCCIIHLIKQSRKQSYANEPTLKKKKTPTQTNALQVL